VKKEKNIMNDDIVNNKIILDYTSVCSDIEEILEEVRTMRSDKYFVKALGDKFLLNIKKYETTIKKRLYDAFQIVTIGDFKRGKSTLINALLGENLLPTSVTPETVTINKISFSNQPGAAAILKNGKKVTISFSDLERDSIEKIARQIQSEIEYVDIKINNNILKEITIIDTPGVGDLLKTFDQQVSDYLYHADALIYVVSARAPLSFSEQAFLSTSVLPQNFSRVFMVVNMADTLETEENINKIEKLISDRASSINPNIAVFMISALDELCRKLKVKRPGEELSSVLEANFLEFETALKNDVILQRDVIKSMRGIALTRSMLNDISAHIALVENSLKANSDKLMHSENEQKGQNAALMSGIEEHKRSLAADIDDMKAEAKDWICDFMTKLRKEVQTLKSTANMSDLERYFQFYLMDMIKNAILQCIERHQKEISDKLSATAKEMANDISQNAFGSINTQIADCITDISWTNIDSAMFVGEFLGVSSLLGPLYLVGQAIAGFMRQKVISKRQEDFVSPVLQEFDTIVSDVKDNIDKIYESIKNSSLDKLDELYQSQVELSMEAIRQAKQIVIDEDTKTEDMLEYLESILHNIKSCRERLTKYE
jgi:ribosome biogenesis GTPase A